jgi:hypothetical protein
MKHRLSVRLVVPRATRIMTNHTGLLARFARDDSLSPYGLRRVDAILVQNTWQAETLARRHGLASRGVKMSLKKPLSVAARDIDVLWVVNVRRLRRLNQAIELAVQLPELRIHMVGGPASCRAAPFDAVRRLAAGANVTFHGPLPYRQAIDLCDRARVLVNTSDVEEFPSLYLQAWIRGVPVVTFSDPDDVIAREGLGIIASSCGDLLDAVRYFFDDPHAWHATSDRCRAFMSREHREDKVPATH